jgi:hypothetical protein
LEREGERVTLKEDNDMRGEAAHVLMEVVNRHGSRIRGFHLLITVDTGDDCEDQHVYRNWENRTHLIGSLVNCIHSIYYRSELEDANE